MPTEATARRSGATPLEGLLDLETVRDLAECGGGGGTAFALELLEMFAAEARRALLRMRVCAWLGDTAALAREAHRLKGSSASMGAARLAAECVELERRAYEDCAEGLEARVEYALNVLEATREGILRCDILSPRSERRSSLDTVM